MWQAARTATPRGCVGTSWHKALGRARRSPISSVASRADSNSQGLRQHFLAQSLRGEHYAASEGLNQTDNHAASVITGAGLEILTATGRDERMLNEVVITSVGGTELEILAVTGREAVACCHVGQSTSPEQQRMQLTLTGMGLEILTAVSRDSPIARRGTRSQSEVPSHLPILRAVCATGTTRMKAAGSGRALVFAGCPGSKHRDYARPAQKSNC